MTSVPDSAPAPVAPPMRRARDVRGLLRVRCSFTPLDWGIAVLVFVGALALDMWRLAGASLWFDETYSIGLASQPIHVMWLYIWSREPNMQLYYLALHLWLSLTTKLGIHPTEVIVRFPSVVFAALSSVVVYLLGRRFLSQTAGILSVILYSLSYFVLMIAQQTRSYSMEMLFIIAAWYALFGALSEEGDTRWWWGLYTILTTLALYAHLFSFFMIV